MNENRKVARIKIKLVEGGKMPVYKHAGDACLDCYAHTKETIVIPSGKRTYIPLGFCLGLSDNYEAVIRPRSGLSGDGIDVVDGTIDSNYRGEVMALVVNSSESSFSVEPNDRICQMAIRECPFVFFDTVTELDETDRGDKGFGSTGV